MFERVFTPTGVAIKQILSQGSQAHSHPASALLPLQAPEEAELVLFRKGYKAPYWRAPELLRGEAPTKASDVYAYGMLLYEILYRREPFEKENKEVRLQPSSLGLAHWHLHA